MVTPCAPRSATIGEVLVDVGTPCPVVVGVGDGPAPGLTLISQLGKGGDAEVWRASVVGSTGVVAAKILTNRTASARQRFAAEIDLMTSCAVPGVIPVIDWDPAREREAARPWYAMPVATPLARSLAAAEPRRIVGRVRDVAGTMAALHAISIAHRDLKPANLLELDGRALVGDFGHAERRAGPGCGSAAAGGHPGARWTAPELGRGRPACDGFAVDVYCLAKTLWMLLAGQPRGFPGQYQRDAPTGLAFGAEHAELEPLHDLLSLATAAPPDRRPTMAELAGGLRGLAPSPAGSVACATLASQAVPRAAG